MDAGTFARPASTVSAEKTPAAHAVPSEMGVVAPLMMLFGEKYRYVLIETDAAGSKPGQGA